MDRPDNEINEIRESFAIQGSIVMNTLEQLMAETDRILQKLNQDTYGNVASTNRRNKDDAYKTFMEDAPPRKRMKL
jgi:hypothetical protein